MIKRHADESALFYLVGGGIASLAAAAFLIRDGGVKGRNIRILEESAELGGSLDAGGNATDGYVMRGGRMFESKYLCTFDLFASIPTLDGSQSVTDETFAWNKTLKTSSKSRLVRDGRSLDAPAFGLTEYQILAIERLVVEPERILGRKSISEHFDLDFFKTDFWLMWCTTFAFQPWHSAVEFKRYLLRFTHMVTGFNTLTGIMRTVYNQYDSLVRPLRKWLDESGVEFSFNSRVKALNLCYDFSGYTVDRIIFEKDEKRSEVILQEKDCVIVTLGSMTEGSSLGSMDRAPVLNDKMTGGAWSLWESIAARQPGCGNPANFTGHVGESKWVSFTATLTEPTLFDAIRDLTGNTPGEGGLITFPNSSWLMSIVLPYQPHFIAQPADVQVFWGYGLSVDNLGDFVEKPMSSCNGREIMTELLGHLHFSKDALGIIDHCICIPCMMPFITSQFLRRSKGDRPQVLPERSKNLAFVGQFCELPDDVVFTVEYSIRAAQAAVYGLLGLNRRPPPVYKGSHDPRVLLGAFQALHDIAVR